VTGANVKPENRKVIMGTSNLPRLSFQRHAEMRADSWQSVVISLLRGLAALAVAAGHLRAEMYPGLRTIGDPSLWFKGLAFFTGFAHQAVIVFFIISGWLVGGSLLNKFERPGAVVDYAIDRATRLWTVLIPTFLLTLLFALGTGVLRPNTFDFSAANEFSAFVFAGNLIGLQGVAMNNFAGNYALWSLANETWYYLMFPLLMVLFTSRRYTARLASGAALVLAAALLPVDIALYFVIWLLGAAFSRLRIDCTAGLRWAWFTLLAIFSTYFRLTGDNDHFDRTTLGMDIAISLLFLPLLSGLQFPVAATSALGPPLAQIGNFFANFSFTLYVLHLPMIFLMKHLAVVWLGVGQLSPNSPLHFAIYFSMLTVLLAGAHLSYRMFESQTYRIRRFLKQSKAHRGVPDSATPAEPKKL
jgi:peptidoglycan/LPS O-acetylase OafA/YrhL